jgi:hypothetical protein
MAVHSHDSTTTTWIHNNKNNIILPKGDGMQYISHTYALLLLSNVCPIGQSIMVSTFIEAGVGEVKNSAGSSAG